MASDTETYFAPAKRTEQRILTSQVENVSSSPIMNTLLATAAGVLAILNEDRQIIGLNDTFLSALGIREPSSALGLRMGETLNCVHSSELPNGCGTTPHCASCGAVIATMSAINDDHVTEEICALTVQKNDMIHEKYLSVRAQPLMIDGNKWILIYAHDITNQHELSTLEHIFYHDINNILTALVGNSDLLVREMPDKHRAQQILSAAKRLCAEVTLQRFLSIQKDGANLLKLDHALISEINEEVELIMYSHPKARSRQLEQTWPDKNIKIYTDVHLLSRIIGNMLLNALEATAEGGIVRLNTMLDDNDILWGVWNDSYIPNEVQGKIFQKHFSTKASMGRGMGTHSMKLFGEKYLHGKVWFESSPNEGTSFYFRHPLSMQNV